MTNLVKGHGEKGRLHIKPDLGIDLGMPTGVLSKLGDKVSWQNKEMYRVLDHVQRVAEEPPPRPHTLRGSSRSNQRASLPMPRSASIVSVSSKPKYAFII
jgi:hypothetical protein